MDSFLRSRRLGRSGRCSLSHATPSSNCSIALRDDAHDPSWAGSWHGGAAWTCVETRVRQYGQLLRDFRLALHVGFSSGRSVAGMQLIRNELRLARCTICCATSNLIMEHWHHSALPSMSTMLNLHNRVKWQSECRLCIECSRLDSTHCTTKKTVSSVLSLQIYRTGCPSQYFLRSKPIPRSASSANQQASRERRCAAHLPYTATPT